MKPKSALRSFLLLAGSSLLAVSSAFAVDTATTAWNGSTVNWTTGGNWASGAPSVSLSALFDSSFVTAFQPQLQGTSDTQGIYLKSGATQNVTITGLTSARVLNINGDAELGGQTNAGIMIDDDNSLTISNNVTTTLANSTGFYVNSAGTLNLSGTGTLNLNAQTLTLGGNNASGNINISQVITNTAGAINVNTSGTVTLSNANLFTGGLTLTAGTLKANGNAGALGNGALALNGGILDFNHSAALVFNRNTIVGANTTIISNQSVAAQAGVNYTLGTLGIGGNTLTIQGGSNVTSGTAGVIFGNTTLSGNAIFDVQNPSGGGGTTLTLGAVTGGVHNFTKNSNGVLNLSADGTGSGTYTVNGGVLRLSSVTALPGGIGVTGGTSALTLNGGALELANGNFTRNLGAGVTQFQITGGESGFSARGGARIVTVNNNAATVVQWGSATFAPTTFVLNAATGNDTITFSNRLDLNGDGVATTRNVAVRANTATMSGIIENLGGSAIGLTKSGAGTLILSNSANSYNGGTTISGGTLALSATGALPSGSNVVLNGGTLHNSGVVTQTAGTLTLTADSVIAQLGTGTVASGGGTLSFSSAVGDWTGLNLSLTGPLGSTSLRIGTSASGATPEQLARITHTLLSGATKTVTINASGYVTSGSSDGYRSGSTGNWSNSGLWSSGMIAGGEDATATFWGTSAGSTTTVNAPITIGHIARAGNKDHIINSSGGNILTLAVSNGMSTINSGSTNTLTISATLAGDDGLEIVSGGTILLSGDNIYTGGTKLTGGTLQVGHDNALGGAGSGTIALNGGTVQSNGATPRSFSNAVTIGGDFTVGGTGNMTFSNTGAVALGATRQITVTTAGVVATLAQSFTGGAGIGLTKAGAGTLALTGSGNTYSGNTAINGGILDVGAMSSGALSSNSYLTLNNGSQLQGSGTFSRSQSSTASGSNWNAGTSGSGGFSARGGKLTINTTSFTTANAFLNTLILNNSASDSELEWASNFILGNNNPRNIQVNSGVNANSFATISGAIGGGAGTRFVKTGTGMLVLTNTVNGWGSSGGGGTEIQAGTLVAGNNAPAAASATGLFGNTSNGSVATTGAVGAIALGNGSTGVNDAPALLINSGFTVARDIQVGALTNANAYTAILGGNNTTGTSTFDGNITLSTTATNYTVTLRAATGGTVEFKTGTWTNANNKGVNFGSSGNTGTVLLSNILPNTSGAMAVKFGTLQLGGAAVLGGSSVTASVDSGAVLDVNGQAVTNTYALTLNGTGISSGGALISSTGSGSYAGAVTLASDSSIGGAGNLSIGGAIGESGTRALTKVGNGTLTLTNNTNDYTGATNVEGGTLVVNGNISTSVLTTVKTGATLGGSGTVGTLTIDDGGFFSPGNSPGIETVIGDYTQNGTLQVEIEGLVAGNGAGFHDRVDVTGTVTLGLTSVLSLTTFTGSYSADDLMFILLNDSIDAVSGTFTGLAQGATVTNYGGFDWIISYNADSTANTFTGTANGNDIALMAIPEPRAALLGGLGMLLLLRRRR